MNDIYTEYETMQRQIKWWQTKIDANNNSVEKTYQKPHIYYTKNENYDMMI